MQPKYLLTILDLGLGPMTVAIRELSREQVEKILDYLNPVSGYSGFLRARIVTSGWTRQRPVRVIAARLGVYLGCLISGNA